MTQFGLNVYKIFQQIWKKAYQSNVQSHKTTSRKFLGELSDNLVYAFEQCNTVHVLSEFNLTCLNVSEKNNLESIIAPYCLQIVDVHEPTRLAQNSESKNDCFLAESLEENRQHSFDMSFKSDHLAFVVVTYIKLTECKAKRIYCFEKNSTIQMIS